MTALTECGTALHDKNSFKNKLDEVNAYVSGFAGKNYFAFTMNCIKSDFNTVWPLYRSAYTT
jgi:zinc protease